MMNSACQGVRPVRHAHGAVRQKARVALPGSRYHQPMLRTREQFDKAATIARFSVLIAAISLMTSTFMRAASPQTSTMDTNDARDILPSGLGDAIDHDVMKVRDATTKFKTTEAAEAAGYKRVTNCVEYKPQGAMGYHFQNNTILDTTLDLEHPEVLVYEKMPDGTFKLNGVEFLVPISAWKAAEPPRIMGQPLKKADRIGIWYLLDKSWKKCPSGLFADWNPEVKCGEESSMPHH